MLAHTSPPSGTSPAYHVGSSLTRKLGWRDVDVRLILDDDEYAAMQLGDPTRSMLNEKWVALCLAFSALGKQLTGLPIDFQIQQQSYANKKFNGPRSPIGLVPWRIMKPTEETATSSPALAASPPSASP